MVWHAVMKVYWDLADLRPRVWRECIVGEYVSKLSELMCFLFSTSRAQRTLRWTGDLALHIQIKRVTYLGRHKSVRRQCSSPGVKR